MEKRKTCKLYRQPVTISNQPAEMIILALNDIKLRRSAYCLSLFSCSARAKSLPA
jgi:hypothetical protein